MSNIVIAGDTSGSVTLQAQAVSGSTTLTLPTTSGTLLTTTSGQWITSGSDIYYNTGNVGIGTTSPDTKFQVSGTSGSPQFQAGTDVNGYFQVNAFDTNPVYCVVGGTNATAGVFGTQTNIPTIFFTNNTERMRIDSSGNVGIGLTPITGYKLAIGGGGSSVMGIYSTSAAGVAGNALVRLGNSNGTDRWQIQYDCSDNGFKIYDFNATVNRFLIDSAGNVGIGTSSPTAKLNVSGGSLAGAAAGAPLSISSALGATRLITDSGNVTSFIGSYYDSTTLEISQGSTSGYVSGIVVAARSATATVTDAIALYTRSAERMRIDGPGNVLVSTNTLYGYQPAPTSKSAAATLTGAELIVGILNTTGTTYTITLPTGTNIDAAVSTALAANGSFDWYVINTASGTVTIAANGNTTLGTLTIATGVSAHFVFRKTAANTYTVYRVS